MTISGLPSSLNLMATASAAEVASLLNRDRSDYADFLADYFPRPAEDESSDSDSDDTSAPVTVKQVQRDKPGNYNVQTGILDTSTECRPVTTLDGPDYDILQELSEFECGCQHGPKNSSCIKQFPTEVIHDHRLMC